MAHEKSLPPPRIVTRPKPDKDGFGDGQKPRVRFFSEELPQLKTWSINGKYYLAMEVTQIEAGLEKYGKMKGKTYAEFEVDKVTAKKDPIK